MENCNSISYVGKILQERLVAQGLSVHQLAKKSGISSGLISQIERGIANPSLNTINSLTTALGLQLGLFFEDQPEEEKSDIVIHKNQRRKLRVYAGADHPHVAQVPTSLSFSTAEAK